jgi:hypothetical protein
LFRKKRNESGQPTPGALVVVRDRVGAVLADRLAESREQFGLAVGRVISAAVGAGMLVSSGFLLQVQRAATDELRKRADIILGTWKRLLEEHDKSFIGKADASIRGWMVETLSVEYVQVEAIIRSVVHAPLTLDAKFLTEQFERSSERLRSEPLHASAEGGSRSSSPVLEVKPSIWGISLNLNRLVEKVRCWWKEGNT